MAQPATPSYGNRNFVHQPLAAPAPKLPKALTSEREMQIIALVAEGLKNSDIAGVVGTSEHVVKNQLRSIYDKLGMWNRVELALWYEARREQGSF